MGFKDQVAADLSTFINVDEFAASIEIDGSAVACILDETEGTNSLPGAARQPWYQEGTSERDATLYAQSADLATPAVGQRMEIGERQANVIKATVTDGLLTIGLRWFDS